MIKILSSSAFSMMTVGPETVRIKLWMFASKLDSMQRKNARHGEERMERELSHYILNISSFKLKFEQKYQTFEWTLKNSGNE
jgi:hypothetical protein